jgi:hypothetical protein
VPKFTGSLDLCYTTTCLLLTTWLLLVLTASCCTSLLLLLLLYYSHSTLLLLYSPLLYSSTTTPTPTSTTTLLYPLFSGCWLLLLLLLLYLLHWCHLLSPYSTTLYYPYYLYMQWCWSSVINSALIMFELLYGICNDELLKLLKMCWGSGICNDVNPFMLRQQLWWSNAPPPLLVSC